MNYQLLTTTLPESAIEWRIQTQGAKNGKPWAMVVPYADARYLMTVLDAAVGPENWSDEYDAGPDGGVRCTLRLRIDGDWISKQDVAENTQVEAIKGGVTDAFKRACVKWNVANIRSLYGIGDCWAIFTEGGKFSTKIDGKRYNWNPPKLDLPGRPDAAPVDSAPVEEKKQAAPDGAPATKAQKELVAKVMKSHVITDEERDGIIATMRKEGTKAKAAEIIDWLTDTVAERKREEKEATDPNLQAAIEALDLEPVN